MPRMKWPGPDRVGHGFEPGDDVVADGEDYFCVGAGGDDVF